MKKIILLLIFVFTSISFAIDKISTNSTLEFSDKSLTTNFGVLLPQEIIRLENNNDVKMYLPDGTLFRGVVTKTSSKENYHFECFGEISSHPNAGFGFILNTKGLFGAVVMRDTDTVYYVKYSEEANGYMLIKRVTPTVRI